MRRLISEVFSAAALINPLEKKIRLRFVQTELEFRSRIIFTLWLDKRNMSTRLSMNTTINLVYT
jgi:hypothetical protein